MKPKIIFVVEAPTQIKTPHIQAGFKNREAVENWAEHHGLSLVYYWEARQRIYADKSQMMAEKARQLQRQSKEVLAKVLKAVETL